MGSGKIVERRGRFGEFLREIVRLGQFLRERVRPEEVVRKREEMRKGRIEKKGEGVGLGFCYVEQFCG